MTHLQGWRVHECPTKLVIARFQNRMYPNATNEEI